MIISKIEEEKVNVVSDGLKYGLISYDDNTILSTDYSFIYYDDKSRNFILSREIDDYKEESALYNVENGVISEWYDFIYASMEDSYIVVQNNAYALMNTYGKIDGDFYEGYSTLLKSFDNAE